MLVWACLFGEVCLGDLVKKGSRMRNILFGIIIALAIRCVYDYAKITHAKTTLTRCQDSKKTLYIQGFRDGQENCFDDNGSGVFDL
jgi:hypothetical protein